LVKAFPQPSQKYEETVCVAAVTEDGREMLRLYPIRYRHLPKDRQFDRFDLVELDMEHRLGDTRPESRHVVEDSIRVIESGKQLPTEQKIALWRGHIVASLTALIEEQKINKRSFGVVRPDPGSVKFYAQPIDTADAEERELTSQLFEQQSLLEDPLKPLKKPSYSFGYQFTSDGHKHRCSLLDWEAQAAWFNYQRLYGDDALKMMRQEYGERIPQQNLHLIFGNQHKRPWQFIVIGVLRSSLDPAELDKQGGLF
jgi:hypothetical protein